MNAPAIRIERTAVEAIARKVYDAERIPGEASAAQVDSYAAIAALAGSALAGVRRRPLVLGLCGSQGSGKSTTARIVEGVLGEVLGLKVATLSLDDLYLSREARASLAARVHPLLATRGVPGTHDVTRGLAVIEALGRAGPDAVTLLPRFDKARDEPAGPAAAGRITGSADVLIFEGWCVGAVPEPDAALLEPVNALEAEADPDARWRRRVNAELDGAYRALFARIDKLVLLRAPRFERIVAWRQEQERKLALRIRTATSSPAGLMLMSDAEVERFVMHYERLTRHILGEMPSRAELVVELGDDREVLALTAKR